MAVRSVAMKASYSVVHLVALRAALWAAATAVPKVAYSAAHWAGLKGDCSADAWAVRRAAQKAARWADSWADLSDPPTVGWSAVWMADLTVDTLAARTAAQTVGHLVACWDLQMAVSLVGH